MYFEAVPVSRDISFVKLQLLHPAPADDDCVELNVPRCQGNMLGTNCDQCLSMVQCCFTSTETIRLIRTGSPRWPPQLSHSS